jgi:tetratricopeptide (TPR) repeat protein
MDLAEGHPEWSPALAVHAIPHHLFRAALAGLPRERLGPELQKALRRGVADLDRLVPDEPAVHLFIYQLCARPPGRKHPGHRRAPWRAGQPRDCLRRLEALTAAPQPERAAQAWGMLASRAVMEGHFRQAAGYQRRAVELAPDLPQAWECLVGLQTAAGLYPEAREVGRDLVRRFPSARSHFFLAKALDAGGDTEEAVRHLQAALDLDPDHFHANLAMAVVHLRRAPLNPILSPPEPGVDTPLTQAARCLERAGDALPAREAAGEDVQEDRAAHLAVGGVWHALSQNTPLARTCLADALELCPNHKPAARYLGLLGGRAAQKPTGESFGRLPWD